MELAICYEHTFQAILNESYQVFPKLWMDARYRINGYEDISFSSAQCRVAR